MPNMFFQLRLDFVNFNIAGPTANMATIVLTKGGVPNTASGIAQSAQTQCQTDTFSVTNPSGSAPPVICGVNTGQHSKGPFRLSDIRRMTI